MIYTPLKFVNVGNNTIVCATRILTIMPTATAPGQRILRRAKKEEKYIDACLGRACKGLVITDMDTVIGSIITPQTLLKRLNKFDLSVVDGDETIDSDALTQLGGEFNDEEEDEDGSLE